MHFEQQCVVVPTTLERDSVTDPRKTNATFCTFSQNTTRACPPPSVFPSRQHCPSLPSALDIMGARLRILQRTYPKTTHLLKVLSAFDRTHNAVSAMPLYKRHDKRAADSKCKNSTHLLPLLKTDIRPTSSPTVPYISRHAIVDL